MLNRRTFTKIVCAGFAALVMPLKAAIESVKAEAPIWRGQRVRLMQCGGEPGGRDSDCTFKYLVIDDQCKLLGIDQTPQQPRFQKCKYRAATYGTAFLKDNKLHLFLACDENVIWETIGDPRTPWQRAWEKEGA